MKSLKLIPPGTDIILASQSPRRSQLLQWAEIPFRVVVSDADESFPPGLPPDTVACLIARKKADTVHALHPSPEVVVIAADTLVVVDDVILGKPENADHAAEMLLSLQNREHRVITGVTILHGEQVVAFSEETRVEFHPLDAAQIGFYINKYQPYDKAGAYAIQEWIGVVGIRKITGDFYNVMGLPVSRVVQALQALLQPETS
jgi:septum formation protein